MLSGERRVFRVCMTGRLALGRACFFTGRNQSMGADQSRSWRDVPGGCFVSFDSTQPKWLFGVVKVDVKG